MHNSKQDFNKEEYYKILCQEFPEFLTKYLQLPILKRLSKIGLLCGTDWTTLYHNNFYYSRLDHSLGVALIIWNFTRNKAQTIAGLLHDVSSPVFSHVSDFRKGDALTQTATEESNCSILRTSSQLLQCLKSDNLSIDEVENYHIYPVADNEIPQLSADRLEYMFPSGMALHGNWTLNEVKSVYDDITILKNENNMDELGFSSIDKAELYCERFCGTGHLLQLNENKLTMQLLGQIMNLSVKEEILSEDDFMNLGEEEILKKLEIKLADPETASKKKLLRLYKTFRTMTSIEHTDHPLPEEDYFCIKLKVKQRYINPLVCGKDGDRPRRLSEISEKGKTIIQEFLDYNDTEFGCVKLVSI